MTQSPFSNFKGWNNFPPRQWGKGLSDVSNQGKFSSSLNFAIKNSLVVYENSINEESQKSLNKPTKKFRRKTTFLQNYLNQKNSQLSSNSIPSSENKNNILISGFYSYGKSKKRNGSFDSNLTTFHGLYGSKEQKGTQKTTQEIHGQFIPQKENKTVEQFTTFYSLLNRKFISRLWGSNLNQRLRTSFLASPGEFFPHKKAFMHYWVLPFVGLAGYVYFTKFQFSNNNLTDPLSTKRIFQKHNKFFDSNNSILPTSLKFQDESCWSKTQSLVENSVPFYSFQDKFSNEEINKNISSTKQKIQNFEKIEIQENSFKSSIKDRDLQSSFFLNWLPVLFENNLNLIYENQQLEKYSEKERSNFSITENLLLEQKETKTNNEKVPSKCSFIDKIPGLYSHKDQKRPSPNASGGKLFQPQSKIENLPVNDYKNASKMLDIILKTTISDSSKLFLNKAKSDQVNQGLTYLSTGWNNFPPRQWGEGNLSSVKEEMLENEMKSDLLNKMKFVVNSLSFIKKTNYSEFENFSIKDRELSSFQVSKTFDSFNKKLNNSQINKIDLKIKQKMVQNFQNLLLIKYLSNNLKTQSKIFQSSVDDTFYYSNIFNSRSIKSKSFSKNKSESFIGKKQFILQKEKNPRSSIESFAAARQVFAPVKTQLNFRNQLNFYKTYLNLLKKEKRKELTVSRFLKILNKIQTKEKLQFINQNLSGALDLGSSNQRKNSEILKWRIYELSTLRSFVNQNKFKKIMNDFQNKHFLNSAKFKSKVHELPNKSLLSSNFKAYLHEEKSQKIYLNSKIENYILSSSFNRLGKEKFFEPRIEHTKIALSEGWNNFPPRQLGKGTSVFQNQEISILFQPPMFYWSFLGEGKSFLTKNINIQNNGNFQKLIKEMTLNKAQFDSSISRSSIESFAPNMNLMSTLNFQKNVAFSTLLNEDLLSYEHQSSQFLTENWKKFVDKIYLKMISIFQKHTQSLTEIEKLMKLDKKLLNSSFLDFEEISSLKNLHQQTFYSNFSFQKQSEKYYKLKVKNQISCLQKPSFLKNRFLSKENRKQEKVFRTYLSWKANSSSNKKLSTSKTLQLNPSRYFYMKKVLKTFKNQIKKEQYIFNKPVLSSVENKTSKNGLTKKELQKSEIRNKDKYTDKKHYFSIEDRELRSSTTLLRRIGFLFRYQNDKSEFQNKESILRIEKHRSQQKKRRRKKQKRFFPRPIWLRFLLYKNFLANRHLSISSIEDRELYSSNHLTLSSFPEKIHGESKKKFQFLKSTSFIDSSKLEKFHINEATLFNQKKMKSLLNSNKKSKLLFQSSNFKNSSTFLSCENQIYRNNKLIWHKNKRYSSIKDRELRSNLELKQNRKFQSSKEKIKTFNHHDYYQISNQVMSDFQKLCWKSYWLRTSLNPYIERVQNSLKNCLSFKKQTNLSHINQNPFILNSRSKIENSSIIDRELHSNFSLETKINSFDSDFDLFQNIQNRAEYDRILYDRISDIILNVKANLGSTESSKGLNQGIQSFKVGRSKKENLSFRLPYAMSPNKSNSIRLSTLNQQKEEQFLYRFGLFINNNLNLPSIQAFSLQSPMDNSIKPFGDIPTLRSLWALNQTNILTNENPQIKLMNENQKLWSTLKLRQQNTSNKTKKFFYTTWKKLIEKGRFWRSNLASPGNNNFQATYGNQVKILNQLSLQKLEIAEKKLAYLGIHLKTNKAKLRYLKMKFQLNPRSSIESFAPNKKMEAQKSSLSFINEHERKSFCLNSVTNVESQKQAKRSIQFWWSFPEDKTSLNFPLNSNNSSFNIFSLNHDQYNLSDKELSSSIYNSQFLMTGLWGCTLLFHICSLFAVLQISEIRSLGKFYLLVLYKLSNSYLILAYTIFDLLKNYSKQVISIFETVKTMRKSKNIQKKENQNMTLFYSKSLNKKSKQSSIKDREQSIHDNSFSVIKYNYSFSEEKNSLTRLKQNFSYSDSELRENKISKSMIFTKVYYQIDSNQNLLTGEWNSLSKIGNISAIKGWNNFPPLAWGKGLELRSFENKKFISRNFTNLLEMFFYLPNTLRFSVKNKNKENLARSSSFMRSSIKDRELRSSNFQIEKTAFSSNLKVQKNFIFSSLKNRNKFIYSFLYSNFKFYSKYFQNFQSLLSQKENSNIFLINKQKQLLLNSKIEIQNLYSFFWIGILSISKTSISVFSNGIGFIYSCAFKIIDLFEGGMMLIYKFLEKPAEFMIEWIAQLFLVEWSSDIPSFVPESFDIYSWRSFRQISRGSRIFSLFGFLIQRRLWCLFEIFLNLLTKPDSDLQARQRKGMIFWDVWAEILMIAAEKYRINLSSLTTVKEEQDAFLERLLNDPNWLTSEPSNNLETQEKQSRALAELQLLTSYGERPESWSNFHGFHSFNRLSNLASYSSLTDQTFKSFDNKEKRNFLFSKKTKMSFLLNSEIRSDEDGFVSNFQQNWKIWQRWATNQHFTSQGTDTDLFIDVHPPKSFVHLTSLKPGSSGISGLQTLGLLTCQIYSGLFSKQISKNILIVGSPGNSKSQFVHALAGETELKIIADNAYRYAHIQRGIAVGMKLLRDVFDGLALHTPCLFLMEDIHVIGERRPMLISDNENAKAAESPFTAENEEVHEKNQFIYQLNKHAISDFRKPYKGDFSLLIPTNHFCFDLFLGVSPPKVKFNSQRTAKTPRSPFPLETKFFSQTQGGSSEASKNTNGLNQDQKLSSYVLKSLLQFPSEQFFAPPATSPFTILGMKEQREFKATQIVKEMPWGGFSNDQIMLIPKVTYSVRAKIALLADMALNQLSVKLDMITDLLVIMDNVRSNRGFVVFATTHIPFVLDPALRRPGRLDETISLPFLPTLMDRFEILKSRNLTSSLSSSSFREQSLISTGAKLSTVGRGTIDFMSYSFLFQNSNETDLSNIMLKAKLLLFNKNRLNLPTISTQEETKIKKRKNRIDKTGIYSLNQALSMMTQSEIFDPSKVFRVYKSTKVTKSSALINYEKSKSTQFSQSKSVFTDAKTCLAAEKFVPLGRGPSSTLALTYAKVAKFLVQSQLLKDSRSFREIFSSFLSTGDEFIQEGEQTIFRNLYCPSIEMHQTLINLLSSKAGEFFVFSQIIPRDLRKKQSKNKELKNTDFIRFQSNLNMTNAHSQRGFWTASIGGPPNSGQIGSGKNKLENTNAVQAVGMEEFWSSATSFVFSILQKRYLYNKTLLTNRFLYFNDISTLKEPPSPPGSTILMFGKKYENFKRTERDFQQKSKNSIFEKIQLHQQQRHMKSLYERPIIEVFRSEMVQGRSTSFNSSIKELGYYDSYMRKPTSVNSYYRNRVLTRQRFSFVNQWWNGQFAEHNLETTFKSDVDWRSMFVESFGDIVIDFPDADQHYNPKLRRWFLQSTYGGYWQSFEKTISTEIYQHSILLCFNKILNYFETEREILDSFAYLYLRKGSLNEVDLIATLSKFYIYSKK